MIAEVVNLKPKACPGFSPEGGISLPVCVSHRIWAHSPTPLKNLGTVPAFSSEGMDDCRVLIDDF